MTDQKPTPQPAHPAPAHAPAVKPVAGTAGSLPPEELMTEQEKDTSSTVPGVGPATPAVTDVPPAETVEDLGIGPRTPYPTGNPPPPSETVVYGQGIKGVTDKPAVKPGETKSPGPTPTQKETHR
jgi:hypothetical protein